MSKSQVEIVENAGRLAADLQGSGVESKNAFLSVVATFISDPSGDVKRLRRMMTLLKDGSGGHLNRGSGFGDQARAVIREVGSLLDRGEWQPEELKSLFGWTARLLQVKQAPGRDIREDPRGQVSNRPDPRRPSRPLRPPRGPHPTTEKESARQPAKPLGGLSGKNLDVLKSIKPPKPDDDKS
jgi:hypothetical protein